MPRGVRGDARGVMWATRELTRRTRPDEIGPHLACRRPLVAVRTLPSTGAS